MKPVLTWLSANDRAHPIQGDTMTARRLVAVLAPLLVAPPGTGPVAQLPDPD